MNFITPNVDFKDYSGSYEMCGFYISESEIKEIQHISNHCLNKDVFATKELAESALALAQLSQIIEHDGYLKSLLLDKSQITDYKSVKDVVIVLYYYLGDEITYSYLDNYETFNKAIKEMNVINYILNSNYLVFKLNNPSDGNKIKEFVKDNEELIRKYLMV